MNKDNFDRAFEYALRNEGGYSNHVADSGGATKYGITIGTLSKWRKTVCSEADVKVMLRDEAKSIYFEWYWMPLRLDEVTLLVTATVLFDAAILFGVRLVAIRTQKILLENGFDIKVDGFFGPKTLAALNAVEQSSFVVCFQNELRARIAEIVKAQPKNSVFLTGWENRVDRFTTLIS